MTGESYRVEVRSGIPASAVAGLSEFIATHYLTPNMQYMKNGSFGGGRGPGQRSFSWTLDPSKASSLILPPGLPAITSDLTMSTDGVVIEFSGFEFLDENVKSVCDHISDDIAAMVSSFLDHAKRTSLHFVFSVGRRESAAPQRQDGVIREILKRVLAGNTVNLYLLLIAVSFVFVIFLGDNAIVAILAVQAVALVFSDRLMLGAGSVRVTEEHPEVVVVKVACSPEAFRSLSSRGRNLKGTVKDAIDRAAALGTLDDPQTKLAVHDVLSGAGVSCAPGDVDVRRSNPYSLVKRVSEKFEMPMPKVTLVNSPMDNAAATGISPRHASITITAGALEDLKDSELESVIGHEFGHIKGRDPIILFVVTMVMYLGGLYLWLPILLSLGIFYFLLAFGIIYLVGKFLETRADTESVVTLGSPDLLASALTRIGFTQLYFEKYSSRARFLDWLRFDPHPPIYFRVERLSRMEREGGAIEHTLWVSVRDCIRAFFGALVQIG